jgi:hypothetical protein
MRAVQITRIGGPEVLDVVDLPDPTPGDGEQLYAVSAAGVTSPTPTTPCRERCLISGKALHAWPATACVRTRGRVREVVPIVATGEFGRPA